MAKGGKSSSGRSSGSPGMFSKKGVTSSSATPKPTQTATPSSTTTAPVPAKTNTPMQSTSAPVAPQQNMPPAQPMPPSGGGGLFTNIVGNAIGTATGVVVGHSIMNAFGGGHKSEDAQVQNQQASAPVQQTSNNTELSGPCAPAYSSFLRCLEQSNNNISACQWAWDSFNQCKNPNGPSGGRYYA